MALREYEKFIPFIWVCFEHAFRQCGSSKNRAFNSPSLPGWHSSVSFSYWRKVDVRSLRNLLTPSFSWRTWVRNWNNFCQAVGNSASGLAKGMVNTNDIRFYVELWPGSIWTQHNCHTAVCYLFIRYFFHFLPVFLFHLYLCFSPTFFF